jgi:hypothetical protein
MDEKWKKRQGGDIREKENGSDLEEQVILSLFSIYPC